jgi:hypothetical protein
MTAWFSKSFLITNGATSGRYGTDEYIKQRAKKWKFPWQILKDMDTQARYDYLLGGNRLAVGLCTLNSFDP